MLTSGIYVDYNAHVCRHQNNIVLREYQLAALIHELKSPLAAIQSALELLQGPLANQTNSISKGEYLGMIDRNANRLSGSIDAVLLTISGRDQREQLSFQEIDIRSLCSLKATEYVPAATTKGVEIRWKDENKLPLFVPCDPEKVGLVLSNLLSNAVKYTRTGGISINVQDQNTSVQVSVEDSGSGIPSRELPHIFKRFYRGQTDIQKPGMGLGLSIAKFWVEAHGGEIGASSLGAGFGSQFWFKLPKKLAVAA